MFFLNSPQTNPHMHFYETMGPINQISNQMLFYAGGLQQLCRNGFFSYFFMYMTANMGLNVDDLNKRKLKIWQ